ncbi:MAG: M15 family peptidase [Proteobacteria bacterium]|nr:MAG: M15 family peptidase [Pseudomonadota bacterium]
MYPDRRMAVLAGCRSASARACARALQLAGCAGALVESGGSHGRHFVRRQWQRFRRHPRAVLLGALAVAVPPLAVLTLAGPAVFDFADTAYRPDRQIAALLHGEQLVPPVALPPAMFSTREVEQVRPDVVDASRNWQQLDPEFTQRLLLVIKIMRERYGYDVALIEGYRTPERQSELAALGPQVTQAAAYMSYHQYGLAADCAFLRDGKLVISERDPWAMRGYTLYGEVAESVGLTWGGRWRMRDLGHIELRRDGVIGSRFS